MINFDKYIKELQSIPIDELTEHSKRMALEILLREAANASNSKNQIKILHEPKRKENYGSPDFKIYSHAAIIGYVENKKITQNLSKALQSAQIEKYRELSDNILLTNYLDFIWIKKECTEYISLCHLADLEDNKLQLDNKRTEKVEKLLLNFFSQAPERISNSKDLAVALAVRAKNLKEFLHDELNAQKQNKRDSLLIGLFKTFQHYIFKELTISEFADAFAQMLVYGLFLAKLNADTKQITLYNAKKFIPQSFELIRELVGFLDELDNPNYREITWVIEEVIAIMNTLDLAEINKSLLFSKKVKDDEDIETDPYIYFYESFLAAYDSKLRKAKGVYYTPPQVVNFIISSVNEILKNTFGIKSGFAQKDEVTVLDFATGTGTFIIEILKQIFETLPAQNDVFKDMIIKNHILKNIYGFEYLIAPYTIAHLKLSQFLKENGYNLQENDRFQLFLTNTLEPIADIPPNLYAKALSQEGKLAQKIKDKNILVITGNPPYSGNSKNNGDWIKQLLRGNDIWASKENALRGKQANYFEVDGKKLAERNPKWLQDDYVKFIRFAQYKIDHVGEGVVAIITNHSFLDNPTFRGMRQSLMKSFDQLYFIDLHGNAKKKEKTPEGGRDQNVFDIEQGVAISILVKKKGLKKGIFHRDFWGKRQEKFDLCLENTISSLDFEELKPNKPFYLFVPQDQTLREKYDKFYSVKEIFKVSSVGIVTARDKLTIKNTKEEVWDTVREFVKLEQRDAREKFQLGEDSKDWKISLAQADLLASGGLSKKNIVPIAYRPFDTKYTYFTGKSGGFHCRPRGKVMFNFQAQNKSIIVGRAGQNVGRGLWNLAFCSNQIADINIFYRGGGLVLPLYLIQNGVEETFFGVNQPKSPIRKVENFTKEFRTYVNSLYFKKDKNESSQILKLKKDNEKIKKFIENEEQCIQNLKEFPIEGFDIKIKFQTIEEFRAQIEKNKEELTFLNNSGKKEAFIASPEQILNYIYAILHSPIYRKKYVDFLKIDFPRIPFCQDLTDFKKLSKLGEQLITAHTELEIPKKSKFNKQITFGGKTKPIVEKITYQEGKLFINKENYFEPVPKNVYDFYIGGYPVLTKFIKDRKGKILNLDDVYQISDIIGVLSFTIQTMDKIDKEVENWI